MLRLSQLIFTNRKNQQSAETRLEYISQAWEKVKANVLVVR
jgi:hypothetical protein